MHFSLRASLVVLWYRIYLPAQETQETWVQSLGWEDPLEESMGTHSSILAWELPWTDSRQSNGVTRVGHDLVTKKQQQ